MRVCPDSSGAGDIPDIEGLRKFARAPARFVGAMVRAGVLHEDLEGALSIPIPSFRRYLTDRYGAQAEAFA